MPFLQARCRCAAGEERQGDGAREVETLVDEDVARFLVLVEPVAKAGVKCLGEFVIIHHKEPVWRG